MRPEKEELWETFNELKAFLESSEWPVDVGLTLLADLLEEGKALGGRLERFLEDIAVLAREKGLLLDEGMMAGARDCAPKLKDLWHSMGLSWLIRVSCCADVLTPLVIVIIRVWLRLSDGYELIAQLGRPLAHLDGFERIEPSRGLPAVDAAQVH